MCKNCKPTNATPAAEAGTLTDQLALLVRDLSRPLVNHYNDALTDYNEDYIGGLEGMIDRAEKLLATYEESRTRNPEPPKEEPEFRYFHNGDRSFFWKLPTDGGRGYCRTSDGSWDFSSCALFDMALDYEIPNPDL